MISEQLEMWAALHRWRDVLEQEDPVEWEMRAQLCFLIASAMLPATSRQDLEDLEDLE